MSDSGCEGCIFRECDTCGFICSITDGYLSEMDSCPLDEEAFRMSISGNPISSTASISVQNGKGGENGMVSEWEELESWSKEDLIIELVHMRTLYSLLRSEQGDDCPWPKMDVKAIEDDEHWQPGQVITDGWAERIALYAAAHPKDGMFYWCDLMDYGLTEDQAYDVCKKLRAEGRLVLPSGVEYYDPEAQ